MRSYLLSMLFWLSAIGVHAQDAAGSDIGDPAPALRVREWLKGEPVQGFGKGQLYVVEFWATWCKPCIAGMPHLSALAREYRGRINFLSIDVYELKKTSMRKVQAFVDSMGTRMDYAVAAEDSNFMETGWLEAFDTKHEGIPRAFVIDGEGRVAWIGHPHEIDTVLRQLVNGTWDVASALAARRRKKYLDSLDKEASFELARFGPDPMKPGDYGRPDSALAMIDSMVKKEPGLKYTSVIAATTFYSLLKTDPGKAYTYGKEMLAESTFEHHLEVLVIDNVREYSGKTELPVDIYRLAIEAYKAYMDRYPEVVNRVKAGEQMAVWERRINDGSKK